MGLKKKMDLAVGWSDYRKEMQNETGKVLSEYVFLIKKWSYFGGGIIFEVFNVQ